MLTWIGQLRAAIDKYTITGVQTCALPICSYPHKFREVIERAKQFAQCGAATDPFPSRSCFIDEKSAEYITEAIAECEAKGVYIPPGESCIALMK